MTKLFEYILGTTLVCALSLPAEASNKSMVRATKYATVRAQTSLRTSATARDKGPRLTLFRKRKLSVVPAHMDAVVKSLLRPVARNVSADEAVGSLKVNKLGPVALMEHNLYVTRRRDPVRSDASADILRIKGLQLIRPGPVKDKR
jgi:hypothetical protein